MAKEAGVDFLWAGWAYNKPKFNEYMCNNAKYCVDNLYDFKVFYNNYILK